MADLAPDLIVHTGDLSVDRADHDADLPDAAALVRGLPAPVLLGRHSRYDATRGEFSDVANVGANASTPES